MSFRVPIAGFQVRITFPAKRKVTITGVLSAISLIETSVGVVTFDVLAVEPIS